MIDPDARASKHEDLVRQYKDAGFTRKQGDLLADKILDRRKPWRAEIMIVAILAILLTTAIGVAGQINNGARIDDNEAAIEQIQTIRHDAIVQTCTETNQRHDNTIAALKKLSQERLADDPTPREAEEIRSSLGPTIILINALVPKRDCERRAAKLS